MQGMRKRSCAWCQLQSKNTQRPRNLRRRDLPGMQFNEAVPCGEGETPKGRLRGLKRQSTSKEPTVWVGKNGVTQDLLRQVSRQLDTKEIVKVKTQKSSLQDSGVAEIAHGIAGATGSEIVDIRGRTFTIYRQRKKG